MSLAPEVREAAAAHVALFCRERCPEELRDEVILEHDVRGNAITIIERRAPWRADYGPEWTSSKIAQLRYDRATATWSLHWRDRRERWLRYDGVDAARDVGPLLAEVGADPHGCFWG
jgi:Protein of unknown function (DUF3024)